MDRCAIFFPQNLVFFVFSSAGPTTAFIRCAQSYPPPNCPNSQCPLQIIMRFTAVAVLVSTTLCAVVTATPVPQTKLYRNGNAGTAVPKLREQDFKVENGQVHPSDKKGLSTNKDPNALKKDSHLWSVDSKHLDNHPTLKAVHDGGKNNPGHVSIAHHGPAAPTEDVHKALKDLDWKHEKKPEKKVKKRELAEDWDDLD